MTVDQLVTRLRELSLDGKGQHEVVLDRVSYASEYDSPPTMIREIVVLDSYDEVVLKDYV